VRVGFPTFGIKEVQGRGVQQGVLKIIKKGCAVQSVRRPFRWIFLPGTHSFIYYHPCNSQQETSYFGGK
jgi:hypothetical protein